MAAKKSLPPKKKKVVLVVEDDTATRELVTRALSTKYDVHAAKDALHASELLASIPTPDLIVCDVMMPQIDGFSFVKRLRSEPAFHGVSVIFLTAKTMPAAVVQGIQLGARHYIQKPFSVKDLLEKVEKTLG